MLTTDSHTIIITNGINVKKNEQAKHPIIVSPCLASEKSVIIPPMMPIADTNMKMVTTHLNNLIINITHLHHINTTPHM